MRKLIALFLVLSLSLGLASALADQTVSVSGTGEVLVAADTAVVTLGVTVRNANALKAQSDANEVIARIRGALTGAGFSEEDINTGYVWVGGVYNYNGEEDVISAYTATSSLAVRITDMSRVGEVIDLSFSAGANTLDGVTFSVSDDSAARVQAMKMAVEDAAEKAAVLAEAAGLGELELQSIRSDNVYSYDSGLNNFSMKVAGTEAAMDTATFIRAAKISVIASVTVDYRAK